MTLDVDALMQKIRAVCYARNAGLAPGDRATVALVRTAGSSGVNLPKLRDVAEISFQRREIDLDELMRPSGFAFVRGLFGALLMRFPSQEEERELFDRLQHGVEKIELIHAVRWSEEGIARDVHVHHLSGSIKLHRALRLLGMPARWAYAVARLPRSLILLSRADNELERRLSMLERYTGEFATQVEAAFETAERTSEDVKECNANSR